jgi:hypothetical protein
VSQPVATVAFAFSGDLAVYDEVIVAMAMAHPTACGSRYPGVGLPDRH